MRSLFAAAVILIPQIALATTIRPDEMAESRRWVAAKFEGVAEAKRPG